MMFNKVPPEKFLEFHKIFNGEGKWSHICKQCEGMCEYRKIGSLLPGEKEFVANQLKVPISIFENRYLDKLRTPLGDIDVLKLKVGCPFLNDNYGCTIAKIKVVLCEVYPILVHIENGKTLFNLDELCPLTRLNEVKNYFLNVGIAALIALDIPKEWYEAVVLYDTFDFDYVKIEAERNNPFSALKWESTAHYGLFHLSELLPYRC